MITVILVVLLIVCLILAVVNFFKLEDLKERCIDTEQRAVTHFRKLVAIAHEIDCYKMGKNPYSTLRDIEKVIYPDRKSEIDN